VYVTDGGPDQLLVLDPATRQQVGRFDLVDSLCSIALDQQSQTVYAPTWHRTGPNSYDSSRMQVVNLTTGAIQTFADSQFPTGPFFDQRKRVLYVGNTATPSLFTIDAATGTTHTITLPVKVNRVAVSSQNGDLYLASPEGDKVLVLDPTAGSVVTTLSVGQRPWAVAADPKTGRILVSSELSGGVSLIDPATNQIIRTTPTGSHPRNLAVDGVHERFYVLNTGDRTVSVLDADGRLLSTSAPLPSAEDLSGIAVASQTGQVFVVSKTHIYTLK
jgi:YVTN family beta-propeller protein